MTWFLDSVSINTVSFRIHKRVKTRHLLQINIQGLRFSTKPSLADRQPENIRIHQLKLCCRHTNMELVNELVNEILQ